MNAPAGAVPFVGASLFGQDSDYLYLVGETGSPSVSRILRVQKDNSAPFEELGQMANAPIAPDPFAVHGDNIYWLELVALGRILSCPKSGCGDSPKTIGGGLDLLNNGAEIAVDDASVYILEYPLAELELGYGQTYVSVVSPGRILKCPLTGCDTPEVIYTGTSNLNMQNLLVDDRFIYFRGNDCTQANLDSSGAWFNNCGFIAVIPK
jgi:hypothetical protein